MDSEIDIDRVICLVVGVQLKAELGDRPLAYRVEEEIRRRLEGKAGRLVPVVMSDVYYLNNDEIQERPTISIGGPGVNGVSALWAEELPTAVAIDNELVVQMDLEMEDTRCAVWGMDHLSTVQAVDLFIAKGYLDRFVKGVVEG